VSNSLIVTTDDGSFNAYIARPALTPAPVVVVIQEIFGVTGGLRSIADDLASDGFIAVCPDLFWRLEPGLELSEHDEADWKKALALYSSFDIDAGVRDIAATIAAARRLPETTGKTGVIGFCLGGLMSFLTSAREDVDAAVDYYGGRTDEFVGEAVLSTTPLLLHLAGNDAFMDQNAQKKISATLRDNRNVEIIRYPGRDHAFARPRGGHYHADDALRANTRTHTFLKEHLF